MGPMNPSQSEMAAKAAQMKQQEQQILAMAKGALPGLKKNLEATESCLERIQAGLTELDSLTGSRRFGENEGEKAMTLLLMTILDVQRLQLESAQSVTLEEISQREQVITKINQKVITGGGFFGGAA